MHAGKADTHSVDGSVMQHPLVKRLGEMAKAEGAQQLMLVYPTESGWGQTHTFTGVSTLPAFCKMIQSTSEGAKHCRMCHILMTVAACSGGQTEQRCHAGCQVMISPIPGVSPEALAILSSCSFSDSKGWLDARDRGKKLGLDLAELRKAYYQLPQFREERRLRIRQIMDSMSAAVDLVSRNVHLEKRLKEGPVNGRPSPQTDLRRFLESTDWARSTKGGKGGGDSRNTKGPLVIRVVCELIRQRPDLPLTVKELAAAARFTPNHFTTSFHQHTGKPFTDYLLDQRIERAKKLLCDLTLNVGEISRLVGYDDAGYFARRFRRVTKLSPRTWRNRNCLSHPGRH